MTRLLSALKTQREDFLDLHRDIDDWRSKWFSATTYALWCSAREPTKLVARGLVLDAGSGRCAWRNVVTSTGAQYESIDIAPRGDEKPTWNGDVMNMPQVPSERYDALLSHQVLEHLPSPWLALAEFRRVLKPGGCLIVSVPHLSRRHELPHDYFRFTQEGLRALLVQAGFTCVEIYPVGGLLSFLHHQISCVFPGLFSPVPVIGACFAALNIPFSWLCVQLDAWTDRASLAPTAVMAVARRSE